MVAGRLLRILVASVVILGTGVSLAQASADEKILARRAQMKAQNNAAGPMVAIIKGEAPYDPAVVKASVDAMIAAREAAVAAGAWDADAAVGETEKTHAKPEIWSDPEGFKAAFGMLVAAEEAVAASTDEASFKAAFKQLGAACGNCHEKYRLPLDQ
jgi:cytochrome c556